MVGETRWSAWSMGMLWTQVMVAVAALVVIGLAVPLFVADVSSHDDEWDGFAAAVAVVFGGLVLLVLVLYVVLHVVTRRGRRRASTGEIGTLRRTAIVTSVVSGGWLLICLTQLSQGLGLGFGFVMASPGLVVLIPAAGCWSSLGGEARRG